MPTLSEFKLKQLIQMCEVQDSNRDRIQKVVSKSIDAIEFGFIEPAVGNGTKNQERIVSDVVRWSDFCVHFWVYE